MSHPLSSPIVGSGPTIGPSHARYGSIFGIERQSSGSLPASSYRPHTRDYEQEYPEDPYGDEMGKDARVWMAYSDERDLSDTEMLGGWKDTLDILLVFTGLFSAVVTTFVVETTQVLSPDYAQISASLLQESVALQRAIAMGQSVESVQKSAVNVDSQTHSSIDVWVNALWLVSLCFSLSTALIAVLVKQWIHSYMSFVSGSPRDRALIRQYRYMGIQRWKVSFIVGILPILLHLALFIFLAGLVVFLSPLNFAISWVLFAVSLLWFWFYIAANILPLIYPDCPYRSDLTSFIQSSIHFIIKLGGAIGHVFASALRSLGEYVHIIPVHEHESLRRGLRAVLNGLNTLNQLQTEKYPATQSDKPEELELVYVRRQESSLIAESILWLYDTSVTNTPINSIVLQAVAGLPPDFKDVHRLRDSDICDSIIQMLRASFSKKLQIYSGRQSMAERLARAYIQLEVPKPGPSAIRSYSGAFLEIGRELGQPEFFVISALIQDRLEDPSPLSELLRLFSDKPGELRLSAATWKEVLRVIHDGRRFELDTQLSIIQFLLWSAPPGYTKQISPADKTQRKEIGDLAYSDPRPTSLRALWEESNTFKKGIAEAVHIILTHNLPEIEGQQRSDLFMSLYHLRWALSIYQTSIRQRQTEAKKNSAASPLPLKSEDLAALEVIEPHLHAVMDQISSRMLEWAPDSTVEHRLWEINASLMFPFPFQHQGTSPRRIFHKHLNVMLRLLKLRLSTLYFLQSSRSQSLRNDYPEMVVQSLKTLTASGNSESDRTHFIKVSEFISELLGLRDNSIYPAIHAVFLQCDGFQYVRKYLEAFRIHTAHPRSRAILTTLAQLIYSYLEGVYPSYGSFPGPEVDHTRYLAREDHELDHRTWCHDILEFILSQYRDDQVILQEIPKVCLQDEFPRLAALLYRSPPTNIFIPPAPTPDPLPRLD
ncbi:hypothetical protein VNI00_017874 [Paramarasmius palmivorus]|uniref:DUF6535 domain-containing protein n=1 Tax=Paramarasmius palmivorus TaxID=297713 RepID=A0AAW0B3W9_9AGAR